LKIENVFVILQKNFNKIKKLFFTTTILLFSICLFSQNKQDLEKYYSNVWKAEQYMSKKNYKKAAKYYETAFKNKEFAFFADYQNALLCCEKAGINNNFAKEKFIYTPDTTIINTLLDISSKKEMIEFSLKYGEYTDAQKELYLRQLDTFSIIVLKDLSQKANIFDERLIIFFGLDLYFSEYFSKSPQEQDYFLTLMLNAVRAGTLDVRNYIQTISLRNFNLPPNKDFNFNYFLDYLTIYKKFIKK